MKLILKQKGFTIVELLIVIVVIGILAAITIVAYNGIQTRARDTKIKNDVALLVKAVTAARESETKTLGVISGSYSTAGPCTVLANGTDLAALASTHACWTRYKLTLAAISTAGGVDVNNLVDPWNRPYFIDENEGESGGCGKDTIAAYTNPFVTGYVFLPGTASGAVPRSGYSGCAI